MTSAHLALVLTGTLDEFDLAIDWDETRSLRAERDLSKYQEAIAKATPSS